MRIIFLDIDGVLVNRASFLMPRVHAYTPAHPDCVTQLNRIIEATGAHIVLSSVWRLNRSKIEIHEMLTEWGVRGTTLGKTPRLTEQKVLYGRTYDASAERGLEIQKWMDE